MINVSHSLFIFHHQLIIVLIIALIFVFYKLFKFKPEIADKDKEEDEEKNMKEFVEKLQSYDLFTLQSRIYNKLLMFIHSIKTNGRFPVELKSYINLPALEDESELKMYLIFEGEEHEYSSIFISF